MGENIKMTFQEMRIITKNRVDSAQDRDYWKALVNTVLGSGSHEVN